MKKSLLTFIILTITVASVFGQAKIGIQAGLNLSTVSQNLASGFEKTSLKISPKFNIGLVMELAATENIAIRPALLFSSKGYSIDVEEEFGARSDDYARITNNYITVPVNAVFKIGNFEISAGPYASMAIFGKGKVKVDGNTEEGKIAYDNNVTEDDSFDDDVEDVYKRTDFGAQIGIGYNIAPITITAGFSKGFSNIIPKFDGDDSENKITNSVIQLSVIYMFK